VPAVLVTHDGEEAEELGDVVIAYNDGRVTGVRMVELPEDAAPQPESPDGGASQ
jgi:ABC-type sulfate/molybdate transport systems ATPase subunit